MKQNNKSFGKCFFKCFGIMFLIAFLTYLLPNLLKVFTALSADTNDGSSLEKILDVVRNYLPLICIIASVPVSLIYAAIKTSK